MFRTSVLVFALAVGALAPPLSAQTPKTHRVEIRSFQFDPPRIEIHPGDIVEWTNRDFAPHTATGDDAGWDTGQLKANESGHFIAKSPGSFAYHCAFHPGMKGTITVVAP